MLWIVLYTENVYSTLMKQVILVRADLKMPKGKLAVQCSHAAVEGTLKSTKANVKAWREDGMPKIVLKVNNLRELYKYKGQAESIGLVTAVIKDAGKTFFKRPTVTCMSIGPDKEDKIDRITSELNIV